MRVLSKGLSREVPMNCILRTRASRLPVSVLVIAIGSFMSLNAVSSGAGASIEIDVENPLGAAQEAASAHSYDATLTTTWLSQSGLRTRRVTVRADGESVSVVGERKMISSGSQRAVLRGGIWHSIWSNPAALNGPSLTKKYVVKIGGESSIAGRSTTQVIVADRRGRVRDLIDLDNETGLLLRREQRDEKGQPLRIITFEKISAVSAADYVPSKLKAVGVAPRTALTINAPFVMLKRLPGGFMLVGKYMAPGNGRELFYSDGLNSVSVFEWEGSIEPGSLPPGGTWRRAPNGELRTYDSPIGCVSVWDANGMTFAVVSEASALETSRIVAALPQDTTPDRITRISRFLTGPFSWG